MISPCLVLIAPLELSHLDSRRQQRAPPIAWSSDRDAETRGSRLSQTERRPEHDSRIWLSRVSSSVEIAHG